MKQFSLEPVSWVEMGRYIENVDISIFFDISIQNRQKSP